MKCNNCGFENKEGTSFCTKCGNSLQIQPDNRKNVTHQTSKNLSKNNTTKIVIVALVILAIVLSGAFIYLYGFTNDDSQNNEIQSDDGAKDVNLSDNQSKNQSVASSDNSKKTEEVKSKSWKLIGSYSGSGSKTINVPEGKIKVTLSAYPIKNYASNYLYVTGSNGESGGVDWGSKSAVETRSDSFTYTSDSPETFTIEYYETVSWEVEFYAYQ